MEALHERRSPLVPSPTFLLYTLTFCTLVSLFLCDICELLLGLSIFSLFFLYLKSFYYPLRRGLQLLEPGRESASFMFPLSFRPSYFEDAVSTDGCEGIFCVSPSHSHFF